MPPFRLLDELRHTESRDDKRTVPRLFRHRRQPHARIVRRITNALTPRNMNVKDHIKVGATGSFLFINSDVFNDGVKNETERAGRFRVIEARSKDFIIETIEDGKRIYCDYPKNAKPKVSKSGNVTTTTTETFEPTQDLPGYHRFIKNIFQADGSDTFREYRTAVTIKFHGF